MMKTEPIRERSFWGVSQLSLRSILLGMLGSSIITASSMYVALRMSALPWPTIFVAVLSMALLKILGKTTTNEINITQTAMSAGAMVAGGLAFTLPGLWITGIWKGYSFSSGHFWQVLAISLAGMLLGTVLTWFLRIRFIEKESLSYPIGQAAADTIQVGDTGGKKSATLFGTMGFSFIFTLLRDGFNIIPPALISKWLYAKNFFVGIWLSPMAAGIGYMIGTLYTGVWFIGAILSYFIIIPFAPLLHWLPSTDAAVNFKNTSGIGLMVGTGVGILVAYLLAAIRKSTINKEVNESHDQKAISRKGRIWIIIAISFAYLFSVMAGLELLTSILLIVGVFAAATMAATITGETGINPMEIFGIIILLAVRILIKVDATSAFFITAAVAVACGYGGDLLNDYKAGRVLGTNPTAQLIAQLAGGLVGTVIATLAMFAIIGQFGGVGPEKGLPAGQAFAVSQMVKGIGDPMVFGGSLIIGMVLYLLKIPAMTLGIGMYLPFEISSMMFIGGILRFLVDRFRPKAVESGNISASGMLGGEGITGVGIAIFKMITGG